MGCEGIVTYAEIMLPLGGWLSQGNIKMHNQQLISVSATTPPYIRDDMLTHDRSYEGPPRSLYRQKQSPDLATYCQCENWKYQKPSGVSSDMA